MISHRVTRLDSAHDLAESRARGVELAAGAPAELRRLVAPCYPDLWRWKDFVNDEVGILGVLDEPLIGRCVAAKDQFEPGVLNNKTHRAVTSMDSRDRSHYDTFSVIDDLVDGLVVEFMYFDLARDRRDFVGTGLVVPVVGFEKMLNSILRAHVWCHTARAPYLQRYRPPGGPASGP